MKRTLIAFLLFFIALPFSEAREEQHLHIAAAADLKFALDDLVTQVEKGNAVKIDVTYGSSGNFYSQIQNGAPFDLFFSADIDYPRRLVAASLADPESLYQYAVGRIVIWVPPASKIDVSSQHWNALLDPSVQKISIANPEHAPYGRAAVAALKAAGIYDQVSSKLVYGENISQAAQFAQSGNAQAGIIAMSLAVSPAMKNGKWWQISETLYPPIEQAGVVLKNATNKQPAREFMDFVKGPLGRQTLARYGFALPQIPKT
jgi:molybdate transport system substrate-binding protein